MNPKQSFTDVPTKISQSKAKFVDISKIVVGYSSDILKIPALGSCVGLVIYPRKNAPSDRVAVMGHIMLPDSQKKRNFSANKNKFPPAKYSDQAVPAMVAKLEKLGYIKKDLDAKLVGGAKMFSTSIDVLDVGKKNIRVTKQLLQQLKIPIVKQLTGGDKGMKVRFNVRNYELLVTPTGSSPIIL